MTDKKRFVKKGRGVFIAGTDTGVGKTMAVYALALLLRNQGFSVGVFKPVQCGGDDAIWLKKKLGLTDELQEINPYFGREPLSPHLSLKRSGRPADIQKIVHAYECLRARYDILLVEGAGGLMVPINDNFLIADLAHYLDLEVLIVSRTGLGAINHSLLTIDAASRYGLKVLGMLFCQTNSKRPGVPEKTNPDAVARFGGVPILGVIPFMKSTAPAHVLKVVRSRIKTTSLLATSDDQARTLVEQDKKYVWHPFTQMKDWLNDDPLVIDRAEGTYLIDADGRRYLDGVSSLWVTVHGHGHPDINRAVRHQLGRLDHSTMLGLANTPAVMLSEKLISIAPKGLAKVFYSDNGSTSVEVAVKMSYQYWQNVGRKGKTTICHLANSYHGDTLGSVSIGGIGLFHQVYRKLTFKTHQVDFPDCYRHPAGSKYPEHAFKAVDRFEAFVKKNHARLAALVVEPLVQGAAGMIMWPRGVLKRFEQICRKYDLLLICDEVATGFGRTGAMFACEHEKAHPDFMCLAKGLTGGYLPLAATLTTQRVYDGFVFPYQDQKAFFHGHTYTGNPLACAAALANLEVFEKERTIKRVKEKGVFLSSKLKSLRRISWVGDIRQRGLMVGIELVRDRKTKEPFPWEDQIGVRVCRRARDHGVILRPLGNVIVLMPPLSMSRGELARLVKVTAKALNDVLGV